jgi:hypothetical protein
MADGATRWISPYWRSEAPPNFARVFVVNPNDADPSNVTAQWYDPNGNVMTEFTEAIPPLNRRIFTSGTTGEGWMRITSDLPVAPWGETPFGPIEVIGTATMDFYREDLLLHAFSTP